MHYSSERSHASILACQHRWHQLGQSLQDFQLQGVGTLTAGTPLFSGYPEQRLLKSFSVWQVTYNLKPQLAALRLTWGSSGCMAGPHIDVRIMAWLARPDNTSVVGDDDIRTLPKVFPPACLSCALHPLPLAKPCD